jgi:hypothetical protein
MGVTRLAFGGRTEHGCHIVVTLDVRLRCEVQVTTVGLRFAGKRILEVLLSLGALQLHRCLLLLIQTKEECRCVSAHRPMNESTPARCMQKIDCRYLIDSASL